MQPPDPESWSTASKVAAGAATIFAAMITAVMTMFKGTNGRIAAAERALADKADKERAEKIADNLAAAFQQQREDSQRTQDAISKLSMQFYEFAREITQAIGDRPTREELRERKGG